MTEIQHLARAKQPPNKSPETDPHSDSPNRCPCVDRPFLNH